MVNKMPKSLNRKIKPYWLERINSWLAEKGEGPVPEGFMMKDLIKLMQAKGYNIQSRRKAYTLVRLLTAHLKTSIPAKTKVVKPLKPYWIILINRWLKQTNEGPVSPEFTRVELIELLQSKGYPVKTYSKACLTLREIMGVQKSVVKKPRESSPTKPKIFDSFYSSFEWRRLRVLILRRDNFTCCDCGRNPKQHGVVLHVDHRVPLSRAWELRLDPENVITRCEDCNMGKRSLLESELEQRGKALRKTG